MAAALYYLSISRVTAWSKVDKGNTCMKKCILWMMLIMIAITGRGLCYDYKLDCGIVFGGDGKDIVTSMDTTSDGGILLIGNTTSFGADGVDVWILKLNKDGKEEWDSLYGGTGEDHAYSIDSTSDGGIFFVGKTTSWGEGGYDIWAAKLDKDGEYEWDNTFGGEKIDAGSSGSELSDGGYFVSAITMSRGEKLHNLWLLKLDSDGELDWENITSVKDYTEPDIYLESDNGELFLSGITIGRKDKDSWVWIKKIDASGQEQWHYLFDKEDGLTIHNLVITNDQELMIIASGSRSETYILDPSKSGGAVAMSRIWKVVVFVKIDMDGNFIKEYSVAHNDYDDFNVDKVIYRADGSSIIFAHSFKDSEPFALIFKINTAGKIEWTKKYFMKGTENFRVTGINETDDNGFIAAGYVVQKWDKPEDYWVGRFDENGDCVW